MGLFDSLDPQDRRTALGVALLRAGAAMNPGYTREPQNFLSNLTRGLAVGGDSLVVTGAGLANQMTQDLYRKQLKDTLDKYQREQALQDAVRVRMNQEIPETTTSYVPQAPTPYDEQNWTNQLAASGSPTGVQPIPEQTYAPQTTTTMRLPTYAEFPSIFAQEAMKAGNIPAIEKVLGWQQAAQQRQDTADTNFMNNILTSGTPEMKAKVLALSPIARRLGLTFSPEDLTTGTMIVTLQDGTQQRVPIANGLTYLTAKMQAEAQADKYKTPNEIELQIRAAQGDTQARAVLDRMQQDKIRVAQQSRPVTINAPNDDQTDSLAQMFIRGTFAPSMLSKRGMLQQTVFPKVTAMYPNFDFNKAEANYRYMVNPANLRSIGLVQAARPRVEDLITKAQNLQNLTNVPVLDKPMNEVRKAVGNVPVADFESLRNAILQEINTALAGSSTQSDYRIKLEMENFNSGRTINQLKAAGNNLLAALDARTDASTATPYPWDVVRGERTVEQWHKDLQKERGQGKPNLAGKADWFTRARAKNPGVSDQELEAQWQKKQGGGI